MAAVPIAAVTNCAGTSLFPKILAREKTTACCYAGAEGDNFYEAITGLNDTIWLGGIVQQTFLLHQTSASAVITRIDITTN